MKLSRLLLFVLFFCFSVFELMAQNSQESQLQQLEREIASLRSQIDGNRALQSEQRSAMVSLEKRISSRVSTVRDLDRQVASVRSSMDSDGARLGALRLQLEASRELLASLLRSGYTSRLTSGSSAMLSLHSRESWEALRLRILDVSGDIVREISSIDSMSRSLGVRFSALESQYKRVEELQRTRSSELSSLRSERAELVKLLSGLEKDAASLDDQQRAKLAQKAELERRIKEAMQQAAKPNSEVVVDHTLTSRFMASRGSLRSPVSGGRLSGGYGVRTSSSGLKVSSRGIDLACGSGSSVVSVFDGVVSVVFDVVGMGRSVIVRHGDYLTVYTNLRGVLHSVGDVVGVGDQLGRLEGEEFHFELWLENKDQDPCVWLKDF